MTDVKVKLENDVKENKWYGNRQSKSVSQESTQDKMLYTVYFEEYLNMNFSLPSQAAQRADGASHKSASVATIDFWSGV